MSHFVRNVVLKIYNFWLKMKHVSVFVHLFFTVCSGDTNVTSEGCLSSALQIG